MGLDASRPRLFTPLGLRAAPYVYGALLCRTDVSDSRPWGETGSAQAETAAYKRC